MTSRKRKLTDDEVEAQVIADLDDPSAWDEPIYVPPSKSPRDRDPRRVSEKSRATPKHVLEVARKRLRRTVEQHRE